MNLSGLILLVFIGLGVAWLWNKGRKRFGLPVTGKHWIGAVVVFAVLVLLAYDASHSAH